LRPRGRHLGSLGVVLAALFVATGAYAQTTAVDTVDGGADASVIAKRGERWQETPQVPPTPVGGCLTGAVSLVPASTDPSQRWSVGTISVNWKVALRSQPTVKGAVVVVGDSLTLAATEETMRNLIDAGYGPICIDGGVGRRVGPTSGSAVSSGVEVIARIMASDAAWQTAQIHWVVALGTNDVSSGTSTYAAAIQRAITAIGSTSFPIRWVDVRTRRNEDAQVAYIDWRYLENTWNSRLSAAGLTVVGWSAATAATPWNYIIALPDYVHLVAPAGEVLRADLVSQSLLTG